MTILLDQVLYEINDCLLNAIIMLSPGTYLVSEYLRYRVWQGVEQVLISWVGYLRQTWEPIDGLFLNEGDEEYFNVIRKKYQEIKNKYLMRRLKVDKLEIINPHIPNARELQRRLDTEFYYFDQSASESSSPESSNGPKEQSGEPQEQFRAEKMSKKVKRVRKAKRQGRLQKMARKVQVAKAKRNSRKILMKQQAKSERKEEDSLGVEDFGEARPPPKMPLDFNVSFHSFMSYPSFTEIVGGQKKQAHQQELRQSDEQPLQLISKLLQECKIARIFFKEEEGVRQTYYEICFDCPDAKFPIIVHEEYIRHCLPSKLAKFYQEL